MCPKVRSRSEGSGLAVSLATPDAIWMHNDSGDKPRLYLFNNDGSLRAIVDVDKADAVDWEDMCSFEVNGRPWLLIADVGDNARRRGKKKGSMCRLYLLKEKLIQQKKKPRDIEWTVDVEISFEYEDGRFDCESVAVDTERREILLFTKELLKESGLYVLPLDVNDRKQHLMAKKIETQIIPVATGMDIASNNRDLVIVSPIGGVLISRQPNESWAEAFRHPGRPLSIPPRRQGESVCFDTTGGNIYAHSEGKRQPIWKVALP